jgi:serine/threonine-protein kinase RsbT
VTTAKMAEQRVPVVGDDDVVMARQAGRLLARELGMSTSEQTMVATAISEVARNLVVYAGQGEVRLAPRDDGSRRGVEVIVRDQGPGIDDVDLAMQDGYSSTGSLGLGLPGARRLMDEFVIDSEPGRGTTIRMCKWVPS